MIEIVSDIMWLILILMAVVYIAVKCRCMFQFEEPEPFPQWFIDFMKSRRCCWETRQRSDSAQVCDECGKPIVYVERPEKIWR